MRIIYVDGFKIRNTLDDDFGMIHGYSRDISTYAPKFYIPSRQTWIDHCFKKETKFLLKIEKFYQHKVSAVKKTKDKFVDHTRREVIEALCKKDAPPKFKRVEGKKNGCKIVWINGAVVRQYLDPEFIFGGHDLVYSYIPTKEIWLDDLMDPLEKPYILLHEITERRLMIQGKIYERAHEFAIAADKEARMKDGYGSYPGDLNYIWRGLSNNQIIKKYVASK